MDRTAFRFRNASLQDASVSFKFTGVALYYTPSMEGISRPIRLTVDGETSQVDPLTNSQAPSVVWHRVGLANSEHKVVLIPETPHSFRQAIGTFQYTVDDSATYPHEQKFLSPRSIPVEVRQIRQTPAKPSKLPMILGSVFGGLVFLVFIAIAVMLHRQRKARQSQYAWKAPVPPLSRTPDPGLTLDHATSFSNRSPVERKVTMDYESHHLPNLPFTPSTQGGHHLPRAEDPDDWGSSSSHAHPPASKTRVPVPARVHERYQAAMSSPESSVRPLPIPPSRNNSVQSHPRSHPAVTSQSSLPFHPPSREASPHQAPYPLHSPVRKHSYIPNSKLEPNRRGDTS